MSSNSENLTFEPCKPPVGREFTLEDLQKHLQTAIVVEMSTIPLYLYAFYSIKKGNATGDAVRKAIKNVFREEMLHLALAGNTLYSVGKAPILYSKETIPTFPSNILYTRIKMNLRDGQQDNIQTFVDVEAPVPVLMAFSPVDDVIPDYHSIGEFYDAIKRQLCNFEIKEGTNQISRGDGIWFRDGLVVVSDLKKANEAMDIIITQGEGADEGSHHNVFFALRTQTQKWDWHPVVENPQTETTYKGKMFYEVSRAFDAAYCVLLLAIERLYHTPPGDVRKANSKNILTIMTRVLSALADFLVGEPFDDKTVAAPCFNYYALDAKDPLASLKVEIKAAMEKYTGQDEKHKRLQDIAKVIDELQPLPPVSNA